MIREVNSEQELEQLMDTTPYLYLVFYSTWDASSRLYMPELEKVSQGTPQVTFAKANVDQLRDYCMQRGLQSFPRTWIVKYGNQVEERMGKMDEKQIKALIDATF